MGDEIGPSHGDGTQGGLPFIARARTQARRGGTPGSAMGGSDVGWGDDRHLYMIYDYTATNASAGQTCQIAVNNSPAMINPPLK